MARAPYTGLPDVEPTGPSPANLNIQANPAEFGGLVGQATQKFGAESEQAGSNLFGAAIARQSMNNEADARGASNNFMRDAGTAWAKYGTLSGKSAADAYPQFAQQLEQIQQQHASTLASPMARNDFMNASSYMLNRLTLMGSTHAAQQEREYWKQSHAANIETSSQTGILMQNDPQAVDTIAHSIADSATQIVKQTDPSASDVSIKSAQQLAVGKYYRGIIEDQAARDPGAAMATFERARSQMDFGSIAETERSLRAWHDKMGVDSFVQDHSSFRQTPPEYQNNVGNIRASNADFQGKSVPYKGFETFKTPELGVQALVNNLQSYADRNGGSVTLGSAIARWAPPTNAQGQPENDTQNYIKSVSRDTGLAANAPLPLNDPNAMATVAKAMTRVEKGGVTFPDEVFQKGAQAAISSHTPPGTFADQYAKLLQTEQDAARQFPGRPDLQREAVAGVHQQIMLDDTMSQKYDAALQKQQKDQQTAAENDWIPKIMNDPSSVDVRAIAADSRLDSDPQQKWRLHQMLNESLQNNPKISAVSHQTATQLISDMRLPPDNPARVNDMNSVYDAYQKGQLSNSDFNFVQNQFKEMQTPDGQRLGDVEKNFLASVKPSIEKSNPLMGQLDMTGGSEFFRLQQDLTAKVAQYRKDGKNPYDLFDPSKPDYIGKPETIAPYQKSIPESIDAFQARTAAGAINAATPAAPAPPATPPPAVGWGSLAPGHTGEPLAPTGAEPTVPAAAPPPPPAQAPHRPIPAGLKMAPTDEGKPQRKMEDIFGMPPASAQPRTPPTP